MKVKVSVKWIVVAVILLLIIPATFLASKLLMSNDNDKSLIAAGEGGTERLEEKKAITYNPENGKPIVVAGEEAPAELKGQEVSLQVPSEEERKESSMQQQLEAQSDVEEEHNVVTDVDAAAAFDAEIAERMRQAEVLEEQFYETMYKYCGKEEIDAINASAPKDIETTGVTSSYDFPESGRILLRRVIEVFENDNPTEEEKGILREYAQKIVRCNESRINDKELTDKILSL